MLVAKTLFDFFKFVDYTRLLAFLIDNSTYF